MSIYLKANQFSIPHARRIDKLVCAMHADRAKTLAIEADAGFPARSVSPVRVTITRQTKSVWARILERAGFVPRIWA